MSRNRNNFLASCVFSTITSPLIVVSMSMQMSVLPNITIYGDVKPSQINQGLLTDKLGFNRFVNQKAIATAEKELVKYAEGSSQLVEKSPEVRADLVKASGQVGFNKPFRAPVYRSYYECIQGLYKQGILGFYKGNGIRIVHGYMYLTLVTQWNNNYLDGPDVMNIQPSYVKTLGTGLLASTILHFLHVTEARFVLQNRLPNFQSYSSIFALVRDSLNKNRGEMFNGMPGYIPILSILTMANFQFFGV